MNVQTGEEEDVDDLVVEELFVEEYITPLGAGGERSKLGAKARLKNQANRVKGFVGRARKPSVLGGLVALAGLALVTLLFARGRRRRESGLSRALLRLGIAH